jgi:CO dehydrogenase/acetyl-CoA synthase gamma subunit (corrinoid Fe-S protein)
VRVIKCVVCTTVVAVDISDDMSESEIAEKISRHENRCIEGLDEK